MFVRTPSHPVALVAEAAGSLAETVVDGCATCWWHGRVHHDGR